MEIILVISAIVWLAQNAMVEVKHAGHGTTSPRWQAKLAKMAPGYTAPFGWRDIAADLWADHREIKREARLAAARRGDNDPMSERVERLREAFRPKVERTPLKPEPGAGLRPWAREILNPAPDVQGSAPKPEPVPGACPNCGNPVDPGDVHPGGWCGPCRRAFPARPVPVPDSDRAPAPVIPMFKREQVADMTAPSAEITGLDPSIHYAEQVAKAHEAHSTAGAETYVNGLADRGVGPQVIALVRRAQTKSGEAAELWLAVAAALAATNKPVQQAYVENQEAGDKRFQLDGR